MARRRGSLGTALLNTIATCAVASYAATRSAAAPIVRAAAAVHGHAVVFGVSAAMLGAAALTALVPFRVRRDQLG